MSEEESWSDDAIWDGEEEITLTRQISYEILQENEIARRQAQAIDKLADDLGFTYTQSAILLIENDWNPQRVVDKIMNNTLEIPMLKRLSSKILSDGSQMFCVLCCNNYTGIQMRALECGHAFCISCYTEYLKESINSGPESIFTMCPMGTCGIVVSQELFQELLPPPLFHKYKMFILRSFVDKRQDVKWCPFPNCQSAASYPKKKAREIVCCCGYSWCFGCGKASHRPLSCELLTKWNQKMTADDNDIWLLANTKTCPACKNAIQKNLGCMHMTCRCGYQFCWLCLGDWMKHSDSTGGNYRCNTFTALHDKGALKKEERARNLAAYSLQRYEHYFNRFVTHKASLKAANNKLENIKSLTTNLYQIINEGTIFDFYVEAAEILMNAKTSLAYSYALGYYLTSACKIRFYEFIQGELEHNMMILDDLTERHLEDFVDHSGPEVNLYPEFSGFRMEVISITGVVKKYFDECLLQMENGFPDVVAGDEEDLSEAELKSLIDINFSDKWLCVACTLSNPLNTNACSACGTRRSD